MVEADQLIRPERVEKVFSQGIERLLRLDYRPSDPKLQVGHDGRTVDIFELLDSLEVLRFYFASTEEMIGKAMYRGERTFDFIHELKKDVDSYFLEALDSKESRLKKIKYRGLVSMVLVPLIDLFENLTHEQMLCEYNRVLDQAREYIIHNETEASIFDALVVRQVLIKDIARRSRVREQVDGILRLRRRRKSRRKRKAA